MHQFSGATPILFITHPLLRILRLSNHALRLNIPTINRSTAPPNNLFLVLNHRTAGTAESSTAISKSTALDAEPLAQVGARHYVEDPAETAAGLYSTPEHAVCVEAFVAGERRVSHACLGLAIDEAGAESCFQAEVILASEAIEEAIVPLVTTNSSSLLRVLHRLLLSWSLVIHLDETLRKNV